MEEQPAVDPRQNLDRPARKQAGADRIYDKRKGLNTSYSEIACYLNACYMLDPRNLHTAQVA
jgi:hypothetical protein